MVWPLTREHRFIAPALFISYFEDYSYLCLLLIPGQLGERTYNPAVIWLAISESIFNYNMQSRLVSLRAQASSTLGLLFLSSWTTALDFQHYF